MMHNVVPLGVLNSRLRDCEADTVFLMLSATCTVRLVIVTRSP